MTDTLPSPPRPDQGACAAHFPPVTSPTVAVAVDAVGWLRAWWTCEEPQRVEKASPPLQG